MIPFKNKTSVSLLALVCLALSRTVQAVSPPPDGGYPGGNTAEGQNALLTLITGGFNTAVGYFSLFANTTGSYNTAVGAGALDLNSGNSNTATNTGALLSNTTGPNNTATGALALFSNTTGPYNTASGYQALYTNTTGDSNTASGGLALYSNTSGLQNTAVGVSALHSNSTGAHNTALGAGALFNSTSGVDNTALGVSAGIGVTTANNVICLGSTGANVDNTCFIGNIRGVTTQNNDAIPVLIDSAGELGTANSSRRYKIDVKPIDKASESILALKPVSFRYKVHEDKTPQFGLIAEDVGQVNPNLVIFDVDGKPFTVRYDAVNAMLLNEFLKEHRKVEQMQKQIDALTAGLQKVSAQLEVSKSAPQTLLNERSVRRQVGRENLRQNQAAKTN
jgi:hypothetical protein